MTYQVHFHLILLINGHRNGFDHPAFFQVIFRYFLLGHPVSFKIILGETIQSVQKKNLKFKQI